MDIGVYISELLARNGEISVPGLGFLMLQKVPGYYNENDGRFYPPRSEVKFDPQQIDDDETLAQYIADQKNISVSSAKYFADKYVATVREDALVREVHVGEVGSFLADQGRLIFIPGQKPISNPAFFGLSPVNLPKTLPSPAPITAPPPPLEPERPSYSNYTTPERPVSHDFNRPAEPEERRNPYQANTPPPDNTPPSTPPPAAPNRDRQALIDAFNASNKSGYTEQAPPAQHTRPDIFPPMDTNRPIQPVVHADEDEEKKRPIALFILIGLIVVLVAGVFALKKFMPAKFDAIKNIFTHKTSTAQTSDGKPVDTVKIKEPVAVVPPPVLDSATRDSLKKVHLRDSVKAAKTTDSLKKVQHADSIKYAISRIADAKKRHTDSLEQVRLAKIQKAKDKADSIKNDHLAKAAEKSRLAAAALADKEAIRAAKKNKTVTTIVTPVPAATKPPVVTPVPDKNTKVAAPSVQKTVISAPVSTGDMAFTAVEPGKTWFAVAGSGTSSSAVASAKIAGLKKIGIEAFAVKKGGATIFVAMGAYAKNSEAEAAVNKFKQSGVADANIAQITK